MEPRTLKDFIAEQSWWFRHVTLPWAGFKLGWSLRLYRWSEWLRKN